MKLELQILKGLYIIYMFNYFKTSCSIHNPFEQIVTGYISDWFKHPINTVTYQSKICPLGNVVGFLLAAWFLVYYRIQCENLHKKLMIIVLITCFIMNLNAFVYFLPLFIFDFYTMSVN